MYALFGDLRKVSEKKPFIVHTYRDNMFLYSDTFTSRKEMVSHLRSLGLSFSNEDLCNLGMQSKTITKNRFSYEIEELPKTDNVFNFNGGIYIPLSEYCRRTGRKIDSVRYEYQMGRLRGLTVGKKNYVYIYWSKA